MAFRGLSDVVAVIGGAGRGQQAQSAPATSSAAAGLVRGWGDGSGPRAILACPPGEWHDLALMIFGVTLNRHGWRIDYLGVTRRLRNTAGPRSLLPPFYDRTVSGWWP